MFKFLTLWPFARPKPPPLAHESATLICPRCGGVWKLLERSAHYETALRLTRQTRWRCRQCGRTYEEMETLILREVERSGYAFA